MGFGQNRLGINLAARGIHAYEETNYVSRQ